MSASTEKNAKKEGRDKNPRPTCSLDVWKRTTMCGKRGDVQHWTSIVDGWRLMDLKDPFLHVMFTLSSEGRYLLAGEDFRVQCGHDFQ